MPTMAIGTPSWLIDTCASEELSLLEMLDPSDLSNPGAILQVEKESQRCENIYMDCG